MNCLQLNKYSACTVHVNELHHPHLVMLNLNQLPYPGASGI